MGYDEYERAVGLVAWMFGMTEGKAAECIVPIGRDDVTYFAMTASDPWDMKEPGEAVVIGGDGSFLYADASTRMDDHLRRYDEGIRTPFC